MADNQRKMNEPDCDPCVCGDFTTWHPRCYEGLSQSQIDAAHKKNIKKWKEEQRIAAFNLSMAAMHNGKRNGN